jgi:hypothetical protein
LIPRGWTAALAGLVCFGLAQPRLARAQAEELPAEAAVQPGPATPTRPAQPSSQAKTAPQPSSPAAPTPKRPTILFMPYFGFSRPVGDRWAGFNSSPRLGAVLGWHVTERLSLNGECDIDYVRPDYTRITTDPPRPEDRPSFWGGFWHPPRHYIDLTFSPLVSLRDGQIRLGPKVGWSTSRGSFEGTPATGTGLLFGFNAGLFLPYHGVSVGGLLTGSFRVFTSTTEPSGGHHTMGLLVAVLL